MPSKWPPALVKMSALSASLSENIIVVELGQWLVDNGFSEDTCQCFESNLIVSLVYGITD